MYLTVEEAGQYGASTATEGQIQRASALIDAYLSRPEGLVYGVDGNGNPAYMVAPARVSGAGGLNLASTISPGLQVPVILSKLVTPRLNVGDVMILDRSAAGSTEACVVSSLSQPGANPNTITFQQVQFTHFSGATAELGLTITEKRQLPTGRPLTNVSQAPLVIVLSGTGRYSFSRRGDVATNGNLSQFNLLAALTRFGGPPIWELWQPFNSNTWDERTGEVWVPAGIMLEYYTEVMIRYIAGFPVDNIPSIIKFATAEIMKAQNSTPVGGNVKQYKAGDTSITNFAASVLTLDTKAALALYSARKFR